MVTGGNQVVDLSFGIRGESLPADHGYALYGALARVFPSLHANPSVGIHPIRGRVVGERLLALTSASRLTVRVPADRIPDALTFAGRSIEVDGHRFSVGAPTVFVLRPSPSVASRLVVIKGFVDEEPFVAAAGRQLKALGVEGHVSLARRRYARAAEGRSTAGMGTPTRRTIRIRDKEIVGFAVVVTGLSAEGSVRLQEAGLGGRRRFGCGVFVPSSARP